MSGSLGVSALLYYQWWSWQKELSQQGDKEEEQLTTYPSKEEHHQASPKLAGWEFKILRSRRNQFHNPDVLRKVCQEEAQGGWILFEKLDDRRLRFRRPMALREKIQPTAKYDPYRSYYGPRFEWESLLSVILLMMMATLPAYLGYRLVILSQRSAPLSTTAPSAPLHP
ncbi:hypothetical protein [Thermosynechococcus sp.]|uniref:hypothetical protein n=1 Tax=Thermosynechococcus sp. TaxID=2814275 RepID=UPI0026359E68|nr:hypothetical protein [Thermosynechococcus sp.]